jgi:hypothetical protein
LVDPIWRGPPRLSTCPVGPAHLRYFIWPDALFGLEHKLPVNHRNVDVEDQRIADNWASTALLFTFAAVQPV